MDIFKNLLLLVQSSLLQLRADWSNVIPSLWQSFWFYSATAISIAILSILIYKGYKAFQTAGSLELLRGIFSIALFYTAAYFLRLEFLLWVLDRIIPTFLIILAVVMQPELRRIFMQIGHKSIVPYNHTKHQEQKVIDETVKACEALSSMGRGALIVFRRENSLRHIIGTGVRLDARPSTELLVSIFAYDTPLHDGATILAPSRIVASGCILPIDPEDRSLLSLKAGTRHRSAVELVRKSDAVVLVVSEETGQISLGYGGRLHPCCDRKIICSKLLSLLSTETGQGKHSSARQFFNLLVPFVRFSWLFGEGGGTAGRLKRTENEKPQ